MAFTDGSETDFTLGPFVGIYDSPDPVEANRRRQRRLFDALNVLFPDLQSGASVVARHGCLGAVTPLGDASGRTGQGMFMHRRTDGALDRFVFAGGKLYAWDGTDGAAAYTLIPTVGIAIDLVNPVYAVTYSNEVIISDEVNKPWIYTPETGACETIKYNTADDDWSTQGGPTLYSGKVMFIVKSVGSSDVDTELDEDVTTELDEDLTTELLSSFQNTVVYCEELDVRSGYVQDGFDNSITLIQSSDEILTAINGQEGGLVYFRQRGISLLTGKTTDDFQAASSRDTISTSDGTNAPAAICTALKKIWFLDMDGRVKRLTLGGGEPEQLYFPVRRALDDHIGMDANRADVTRYGRAAFHEGYNLVLFTIWDARTVYAFDATTGTYEGNWVIGGAEGASISIDTMSNMVDANNRATFMLIGTRADVVDITTQGVVWRQKFSSDAAQWRDQANASIGTMVSLARAIESHWMSANAIISYRATTVAAQLLADIVPHAVGLQYVVPKSGRSAVLIAQSTATVGEKSATDSISNAGWSLGRNAQGTAMRIRLSCTNDDNVRWGVSNATVHVIVTQARKNAA